MVLPLSLVSIHNWNFSNVRNISLMRFPLRIELISWFFASLDVNDTYIHRLFFSFSLCWLLLLLLFIARIMFCATNLPNYYRNTQRVRFVSDALGIFPKMWSVNYSIGGSFCTLSLCTHFDKYEFYFHQNLSHWLSSSKIYVSFFLFHFRWLQSSSFFFSMNHSTFRRNCKSCLLLYQFRRAIRLFSMCSLREYEDVSKFGFFFFRRKCDDLKLQRDFMGMLYVFYCSSFCDCFLLLLIREGIYYV